TYFDDAVALTRQMKELNVNPKMFGVTVGGDLPEFYDTLKQNAEYIYGATQWEHTLPYPGNPEYFEAYKKDFGHEPSYHSTAGYAGCLIYAEAVKRANSLDADKVREQLLKLGAYTTYFLTTRLDMNPFLTVPVAMAALFVVGVLLQRGLVDRVVDAPELSSLLLTFGISIALVNLAQLAFTSDLRAVEYITGAWVLAGLAFSKPRVMAFVFAA